MNKPNEDSLESFIRECNKGIQISDEDYKLMSREIYMFLYHPQRGYISFVNMFVTTRNNDLGPLFLVTLISAKF